MTFTSPKEKGQNKKKFGKFYKQLLENVKG